LALEIIADEQRTTVLPHRFGWVTPRVIHDGVSCSNAALTCIARRSDGMNEVSFVSTTFCVLAWHSSFTKRQNRSVRAPASRGRGYIVMSYERVVSVFVSCTVISFLNTSKYCKKHLLNRKCTVCVAQHKLPNPILTCCKSIKTCWRE